MSHKLPERIKVLIVTYKLEAGGAERVAVSLARGLSRKRFEVIFCCFKGGILEKELRENDVSTFNLDKRSKFDFSLLVKLLRIIKEEKIDIIHTHSFSPNLWGRVAGILGGVPVIISTEHTVAIVKTKFQKYADRLLSKFTHKIISVSEEVKNSLTKEENISPHKIQTIYNGIPSQKSLYNPKKINEISLELGVDLGKKVIVTIGRLEPPKGYQYLLESAGLVIKEFPSAQFLIVGEGYLRPQLEELAISLKIKNNVIFAGRRSDVEDILSLSDIAVLSSVREGFSVALIEYMASGKPIVATDVGGNKEAIIDNISGLLVPPKDYSSLAEGIIKILKNPDLADQMGKNALDRFKQNFTLDRMISLTQNIYEDLYSRN